jgi:translation initiation factor 2 beta subunit (eIF-2beta)/eIF-5
MARTNKLEPYKSKVVKCPICGDYGSITQRAEDMSLYILKCPNCKDVELLGDFAECPNCGKYGAITKIADDCHLQILKCKNCGTETEFMGYKETLARRQYRKDMNDKMKALLSKTKLKK